MRHELPTTKDLAVLVLSHESELNGLQGVFARTFDKLRVHLSLRFGSQGYYALVKRAMMLASTDFPGVMSFRVSEDGSLAGLQNVDTSEATFDVCATVLAKLIELLDSFIGRSLTVRLLDSAWPNTMQFDAVDRQGEKQ
jgi:hypothetical protein